MGNINSLERYFKRFKKQDVSLLENLNDIDTFEDMKHYNQLKKFYKQMIKFIKETTEYLRKRL